MLTSNRHLSRPGNKAKRETRADLGHAINDEVRRLILDHYPSTRKPAVEVAGRIAGLISSLIAVQTQSVQRSLTYLDADLEKIAEDFVAYVSKAADARVGAPVLNRPLAPPLPIEGEPTSSNMQIAIDWAGPTAGPTALERHFGIARSTLFRWQKRSEVIGLRTGGKRYEFPIRQFVDGRPVGHLADVVGLFGDQRAAWLWLITPSADLDRSPVDLLVSDEWVRVLKAAKAFLDRE